MSEALVIDQTSDGGQSSIRLSSIPDRERVEEVFDHIYARTGLRKEQNGFIKGQLERLLEEDHLLLQAANDGELVLVSDNDPEDQIQYGNYVDSLKAQNKKINRLRRSLVHKEEELSEVQDQLTEIARREIGSVDIEQYRGLSDSKSALNSQIDNLNSKISSSSVYVTPAGQLAIGLGDHLTTGYNSDQIEELLREPIKDQVITIEAHRSSEELPSRTDVSNQREEYRHKPMITKRTAPLLLTMAALPMLLLGDSNQNGTYNSSSDLATLETKVSSPSWSGTYNNSTVSIFVPPEEETELVAECSDQNTTNYEVGSLLSESFSDPKNPRFFDVTYRNSDRSVYLFTKDAITKEKPGIDPIHVGTPGCHNFTYIFPNCNDSEYVIKEVNITLGWDSIHNRLLHHNWPPIDTPNQDLNYLCDEVKGKRSDLVASSKI